MIFLDTSAVYAAADRRDAHHERSRRAFQTALDQGEEILTHSYVVSETAALLQRRLGLTTALTFLEESQWFRIHWITQDDHESAVQLLRDRTRRGLSLIDCMSFVVMRRYNVSQALAFDRDFEDEGFSLLRAPDAR